jgi:nickel-dependent lactate racemase
MRVLPYEPVVIGKGVAQGFLTSQEFEATAGEGLRAMELDGLRVLALIPDGTRTMPMPRMFDILERELGPRVAALDYLVALGTHSPMTDAQLSAHIGRPVVNGVTVVADHTVGADLKVGPYQRRIFNHRWDDPSAFVTLGTIPASDIAAITDGKLSQDVPVALNRLVTQYDHILICGPVFPHEVAGFSGGAKYLFPGIAAPSIIHVTHWLGALITSYEIIGTIDTPVRAVIDRAAAFLDTPTSLVALVTTHDGVAGVFCGDLRAAWREAARLSSRRHIVWVDSPFDRVVSVMPSMYADMWTAAKGMYKMEPAMADGGEVIIYAPHVNEVSYVHGSLLQEIGYHCRDYFVEQWPRFAHYPGGILAHSTHLKGAGTFDAASAVETPRVKVTLATGISRERCERVNLGYLDHHAIDRDQWPTDLGHDTLLVPRAGEVLYRVGQPPD